MTRSQIEHRIRETDVSGTPQAMRNAFKRMAPDALAPQTCALNGVDVHVHNPEAPNNILFLHGGGYVFGEPSTHDACAAHLAALSGSGVIVPDYRLAPEHNWPAPLEDASAVLQGLDAPTAVVGDSAGGHLAINLALQHPGLVSRLALISPNTDRSGCSQTRAANSDRDLMNDDATDRKLSRMMLADLAESDPQVSPLLADLSALPPIFLTASTTEVLLDDTLLFAQAAARAGVPVTMEIKQDLFHMWTLWPELEEAHETWARIAGFLIV